MPKEREKKAPGQSFREPLNVKSRREDPGIAERQLENGAMAAQKKGVSGRGEP